MRGKAEETARISQLSLPDNQSGTLRGVPLFLFPLIPALILFQGRANGFLFCDLAAFDLY